MFEGNNVGKHNKNVVLKDENKFHGQLRLWRASFPEGACAQRFDNISICIKIIRCLKTGLWHIIFHLNCQNRTFAAEVFSISNDRILRSPFSLLNEWNSLNRDACKFNSCVPADDYILMGRDNKSCARKTFSALDENVIEPKYSVVLVKDLDSECKEVLLEYSLRSKEISPGPSMFSSFHSFGRVSIFSQPKESLSNIKIFSFNWFTAADTS